MTDLRCKGHCATIYMLTQNLQFFVALNLIYTFDFNSKVIDYIANINEANISNKEI